MQLWLQTDDAEKADHSAVLAGAPAINSRRFQERCVYCTGTGIELQLPEVPATVLQRVKGSYRYRYHCTVSYSTGDHFQLVVACCSRSKVKSALEIFGESEQLAITWFLETLCAVMCK